jgi:uncharacterized repeat protein (TIGR02543 family)
MVSTRGRTRSTCLSRRAGGNVPSKRWRRFAYGALGLALALGVAFAIAGALTPRARAVETPPPDFTIAFIGDQGLGPDAEAVLQLIADEGADAVLHSGDFDYADDPAAWDDQIDRVLGPDFPYFASVGNHDTAAFYTSGGYQDRLAARMNRLGIPWEGDLGVQSSFSYQGVFFVLTAPAVFGAGDGFHDLYIRDRLAASDAAWRISSWHKNMRLMQVGGKPDSTGWGVYEESRRGGAIIATGHEHSYSRTHLLSSMETQAIASTDDTLVLSRDDPATPGVDEGRSFAFVSGLGGQTIRNQDLDGPWWASIYTRNQGADYGALFGVFNYQGDPDLAYFYFKDVSGVVVDEFFVASGVDRAQPLLVIDDVSVDEGDAGTVEAVFTLTLLFASGEDVSVDYATADGSAVAGVDYEPVSGRLVFSGGATTQQIRVVVNGDRIEEDDETFLVRLSNPINANVVYAEGVGTIVDDDLAVFTLSLSSQRSGSVAPEPPGGIYEPGTVVTLTALPASGYAFDGWSGDLTGTANPATITMDGDRSVAAAFLAIPPALREVRTGTATDASAVATDAPLAAESDDLYLAAIASRPNASVSFVSGLGLTWTPVRAQCAARSQTGVAVWQARGQPTAAGVVTASFGSLARHAVLAVARYADARDVDAIGSVVSANSLGVGGACSGGTDGNAYAFDLDTAERNALVYVAAGIRGRDHVPGVGYTEQLEVHEGSTLGGMAGLSLADRSVSSPSRVSVDGTFSSEIDWAVVALEVRSVAGSYGPERRITVEPTSGGTIALDPPGGVYEFGTLVTATATPDPGYVLTGWSGDLAGSGSPALLSMIRDRTIGASFARSPSGFRVTVEPTSGGSVALDPPGGVYEFGTIVTVTATPDPGYVLTGWSGDLAGSTNPVTLFVILDRTIGASFATQP